MICPKCDHVTKYRDASSFKELKCFHCNYVFAIDPKSMGFGDRRIWKVAEKLSKGGRYFTEQQLACTCLSKTERKIQSGVLPGVLVGFVIFSFTMIAGMPTALSIFFRINDTVHHIIRHYNRIANGIINPCIDCLHFREE